MTELRKKVIDTCNHALEVLIAAYTALQNQLSDTPAGEEAAELQQQLRKIARTGATVDTVRTWAENSKAQEGLVKMGLEILTGEMAELGFDLTK